MRVLVTGGAGNIGSYFATTRASTDDFDLVLLDRPGTDWAGVDHDGDTIEADITDLEAMKEACAGADVVLHLAGDPDPSATWHSLHETNIVGTYTTFVAAKAAGVKRIVFASSIHAVSGYPADVQVKTTEPVNPGDLYGVTKCFGEALGRYLAEQEGVSVIAVRIGAFQPMSTAESEEYTGLLDAFVSRDDLCQLLELAIRADHVTFAIVHGLSDNRFKRLDLTDTKTLLGYRPADDFVDANPVLRPALAGVPTAHDVRAGGQQSGLRDEL